MGQYLASRSDVVPQPIVSRLATMLDSNDPRPYATQGSNPGLAALLLTRSGLALDRLDSIVHTIVDELGDERAAMIDTIDPTPLSTASIAQVRQGGESLSHAGARRSGGGWLAQGLGWRGESASSRRIHSSQSLAERSQP